MSFCTDTISAVDSLVPVVDHSFIRGKLSYRRPKRHLVGKVIPLDAQDDADDNATVNPARFHRAFFVQTFAERIFLFR